MYLNSHFIKINITRHTYKGAAEQKAQSTYEYLINLTKDPLFWHLFGSCGNGKSFTLKDLVNVSIFPITI